MARVTLPVEMTTLDTLFVDVAISAVDEDRQPVDLSADPVKLAFMPPRQAPGDNDWVVASWNADASVASILVGPDGVVQYPAASQAYVAWWTVGDNPEKPARPVRAGGLKMVTA